VDFWTIDFGLPCTGLLTPKRAAKVGFSGWDEEVSKRGFE